MIEIIYDHRMPLRDSAIYSLYKSVVAHEHLCINSSISFSVLQIPTCRSHLKNIIPYFFEFFYRLQSGATLQTAPPRNDLDPLHISGAGDGGRSRLEHRKAVAGNGIVFEGGILKAIHEFAVDFDALIDL